MRNDYRMPRGGSQVQVNRVEYDGQTVVGGNKARYRPLWKMEEIVMLEGLGRRKG